MKVVKNKRRKPKLKKPKPRIPIPPCGSRHKSVKDYDRKKAKKVDEDES